MPKTPERERQRVNERITRIRSKGMVSQLIILNALSVIDTELLMV
jgi:hypothetical protein